MVDDVDTTKQSLIPRPFVTLSYAQTLDGGLATSTGSSQWISAPQSLRFNHELRANHDAIMVGVGTICRVEYPGTLLMSVENEERAGCITVS